MNNRDDEQHWQWENARLAARDAPSKSNHSFGSTELAACKGDLFSLNPPVAVPLAAGRGASL